MSGDHHWPDDAVQSYLRRLENADYPLHHQSCENIAGLTFPQLCGLEQSSRSLYDSQNASTFNQRFYDGQQFSAGVIGTTVSNRATEQLLSPNSSSGFRECSQPLVDESFLDTRTDMLHTTTSESTKIEYQSDEEEEEADSSVSNAEDSSLNPEKTAAKFLAEKRKMKRFRWVYQGSCRSIIRLQSQKYRLTHAQTRYLMSEFARQAHPDAGQRRRLSRDIPGLSPRQVQVWFQNR